MSADSKKTVEPADDAIRRQAIAHLARQRLFISLAAVVVTICAVSLNLTHKRPVVVRGLIDMASVFLWLRMFRLSAKLRSLSSAEPTPQERDRQAEALIKSWQPPSSPKPR